MVFTSRNWFAMQGPVAIILISWNVIFIWETGSWKYLWPFSWLLYLYIFSLCENASLIIVSAETEYISTSSWYRNNLVQDKNTSLKLPVGVFPLQLVNLHRNRRYFVIKLHTWFCLSYFLKTNITFYCIYQYVLGQD
jgi:hypothetical protein